MKYTVLTTSLLAATALARPHGSTLSERAARRAAQGRKTHPMIPTSTTEGHIEAHAGANGTQFSTNWSGAVLTAPPAGTTFDSVSASFVVPTVAPPGSATGSGSWSAAAWVGIDGDTYGKAILQAGIDFTATRGDSGDDVQQHYDAWYEWFPAVSHDFSGISMKAGDTMTVTCTSTSSSQGSCQIENTTNGQKVSKTMSAPSASATLGGKNAEWIVEDFEQGSSLVPLAKFGDVTFSNAQASAGGKTVGLTGATTINIRQNKQVETSVQILSGNSLKVTSLD